MNPPDRPDPLALLLAQLDARLHREILRLRARYRLSLDEFRGLYIGDEQVDALVERTQAGVPDAPDLAALDERSAELGAAVAEALRPPHRLAVLAERFALDAAESMLLLLALAPQMDPKYETLYAYLNNDVTRKWPTLDLALRVLGDAAAPLALRRAWQPSATLRREGLLLAAPGGAIEAAPGLLPWLLGLRCDDPALVACLQPGLPHVPGLADAPPLPALTAAAALWREDAAAGPLFVFSGRAGAGRRSAVAHLAALLERPWSLLDVVAAPEPVAAAAAAVRRAQRLDGAVLAVRGLDALAEPARAPHEALHAWLAALRGVGEPVVLLLPPGAPWRDWLEGERVCTIDFEVPAVRARRTLWTGAALALGLEAGDAEFDALAARFALTAGQIGAAAREAADAAALHGDRDAAAQLFAAARRQSSHALARLAQRVPPVHRWDDLVLPAVVHERLREVVNTFRHRERVFVDWGFSRRLGGAPGIKVLFAGASGTGKTMAASVVAHELGLDLFRIELSAVVSKYIGETEKNLDRIFRAAAACDAILFFDEADALFGKRSEVKDAHDRYANIEVAYLLQKLDEHAGPVVLATNLARHIDEAFARRMHVVLEFPLPDERQRERLWRGMFPAQAPLAEDIDFDFLARQFRLAGGDIRNVALDAAFLAAQGGGPIGMREIVRALARQVAKQGKVTAPADFKQYLPLAMHDAGGVG